LSADSSPFIVVCDFPPSNLAGSPVLLLRLLKDVPGLTSVVAGSYFLRASDRESFLPVPHVSVPMLPPGGRPISKVVKWLLRPAFLVGATFKTAATLLRHRGELVVSVAHGSLFVIVAGLAGLLRQRLFLIVYDDWHGALSPGRVRFAKRIFAWVLRRTDRVIVITSQMQSRLRSEFQKESTVFLTAREIPRASLERRSKDGEFSLTYLGSLNSVVQDAIEFVADAVKSGKLDKATERPVRFRLYTKVPEATRRAWGLDDPRIEVLPWVSENEVDGVLSQADALLLPFSFRSEDRAIVTTAFPAKTADYLASGVPIVVVAPSVSTVADYLREAGAAFLVDRLSGESLAAVLSEIAHGTQRVFDVCARAAHVLRANHDIAAQRRTFAEMIHESSHAAG